MQNVYAMRPEVRAEYAAVRSQLDGDATFLTRLERFFTELRDPLFAIYGADPRFPEQFGALLDAMTATARDRDPELRRLDHEREISSDWLQREQAVGYVCYADRFAGTLAGVRERLPYLRELGVNYLHLMPLLAARPEPNDGGYAVAHYRAVEPAGDDRRPARARRRPRDDNRWMQRPSMDWAAAERRHDPGSVEAALWDGLRRLIGARRGTRATHAQGTGQPLWTGNDHVYGLLRTYAGERLLVLANFSADDQAVRDTIAGEHGLEPTASAAAPDGRPLRSGDGELILAPYQFAWIQG